MAYLLCRSAGSFQIGTLADPDNLYGGTQLSSLTVTRVVETVEKSAFEDAYPDEAVVGYHFEITAERDYQDDDAGGLIFIPEQYATGTTPLYALCTTQQAIPVSLFAGPVVKDGARNDSSFRSFESDSISLRSTGDPDVG